MSRLTKKNNQLGSWLQLNDKYIPAHNIRHKECVNKLGEIEDIEEKLSITLVEAVELCKQVNSKKVVYIKEEWGIDTFEIPDELEVDIELLNHRLHRNSWDTYISLDFYDYGKTWALTKEELEDENTNG